jgi:rubredoxin
MSTPFRFLKAETQSISYTIGTSGSGGTGAVAGNAGQATTLTYSGTTITGNGGSGGNYNSGVAASGGTYSGGDGGANGGTGAGVSGDTGGGGGGAIGTVNGSSAGGTAGNAGANAADVSGFQAAITGAGGYSLISGGTAGGSGSTPANNINGGAATGFGCGGGSAGWYGGNGGAGLYGGGGGGAAGLSAIQTGGAGGGGAIVLQITAGTTQYVVLTSGTSYSLPSTATSFKAWVIGAGGGGAGSPASDPTSGGGGGAGGVAHKTFSLPAFSTVDFEDYYVRADYFRSGNLWSWGSNAGGQLGDNTLVSKSSPVQTIAWGSNWKQVSCGYSSSGATAAIKTDGTLWTWGYNVYGELGDNTLVRKSSPIQTVAFGTNWKQVSSFRESMAAIKTDGTLWLWGDNSYGQLGDNTIVRKSSPVQTIAFGTNWSQVDVGWLNTAAIKTDGTLWIWGDNSNGQLGDNTIVRKSSPVQTIAGGTNWKQVSCSKNRLFTAAIKTDGTLWTWGQNSYGQLGDNTITRRSSPVQTIAGGTNWKQISVGSTHTAAIKNDGTLWMWGRNDQGQLAVWGGGTPATSGDPGTSPVTVSGSKTNATTFTTSNTTGLPYLR